MQLERICTIIVQYHIVSVFASLTFPLTTRLNRLHWHQSNHVVRLNEYNFVPHCFGLHMFACTSNAWLMIGFQIFGVLWKTKCKQLMPKMASILISWLKWAIFSFNMYTNSWVRFVFCSLCCWLLHCLSDNEFGTNKLHQ